MSKYPDHPRFHIGFIATRLPSILGVEEEEAVTAKDLSEALGLPPGNTGETIRGIMRQLLNAPYYMPIVSSAKGYWLAGSVHDVEKSIEALQTRIVGIQSRIDSLREAWLIRNDTIPHEEPVSPPTQRPAHYRIGKRQ